MSKETKALTSKSKNKLAFEEVEKELQEMFKAKEIHRKGYITDFDYLTTLNGRLNNIYALLIANGIWQEK